MVSKCLGLLIELNATQSAAQCLMLSRRAAQRSTYGENPLQLRRLQEELAIALRQLRRGVCVHFTQVVGNNSSSVFAGDGELLPHLARGDKVWHVLCWVQQQLHVTETKHRRI